MARMDTGDGAALSGSVSGKAWVNQILETNPVPVIWVTNRIEQIDPAFRRRFQYHLELKSPPPGAREQLILRALAGIEVGDGFAAKLAERKGLTPAQIRTAVKFAKLASSASQPGADELQGLIERQLVNADKALGNVSGERGARRVVTNYDLGLVNTASRFEITKIVEALRRRTYGTLCFYGPPGTGKTALAEHIAHELQRPLMIRQASDIMSKYVGETEQNMAKMFDEAQSESAVLLLDEADSFLRSRRMAERNYEVSEVNEMLQGMERYSGVFICTTNLFQELDEAALRRFTFKVQFKALTAAQRERMFIAEVLEGDATRLSDEQVERLKRLDALTPGDFAAVKRQIDVLGEAFAPDEFLSQLESEHRVKPEVRQQRGIGFLH
jgi:SpoVK/Ycf46/Vps4 family AAA+-type ATPase